MKVLNWLVDHTWFDLVMIVLFVSICIILQALIPSIGFLAGLNIGMYYGLFFGAIVCFRYTKKYYNYNKD